MPTLDLTGMRPGQAVFEVLRVVDPEFAERIRGTNVDPFHHDAKILHALTLWRQRLTGTSSSDWPALGEPAPPPAQGLALENANLRLGLDDLLAAVRAFRDYASGVTYKVAEIVGSVEPDHMRAVMRRLGWELRMVLTDGARAHQEVYEHPFPQNPRTLRWQAVLLPLVRADSESYGARVLAWAEETARRHLHLTPEEVLCAALAEGWQASAQATPGADRVEKRSNTPPHGAEGAGDAGDGK